jgi:hypothetical protein
MLVLGGLLAGALLFVIASPRDAGEAPSEAARDDPWRTLTSSLATRHHDPIGETEPSHVPASTRTDVAFQERGAPMPIEFDATLFDQWLTAARAGDATASRWVHDALRSCERLPQSATELEEHAEGRAKFALSVVTEIRDQARAKGEKLPDIPIPSADEVVNDEMRAELDRARRCQGLPNATPDEALQWLERSADLGDPEARLRFGMEALKAHAWQGPPTELPRIKRVMLGHLRDSLAERDPRALHVIAEIFDKGVYDEPAPESAVAYYYAFGLAHVSDDQMPWQRPTLFRPPPNRMALLRLNALARGLTPEQVAAARAKGERIYASCCS